MANVKRIDKIREASGDELQAQQKELSEQIFRLRFQLSTGQAEALKRLRDSKKDLARGKNFAAREGIDGNAARRQNFGGCACGDQLERSRRGQEISVHKIAVA